jgi:hypothetical protein
MLFSPLWPDVASACDIGSSGYFAYTKAPYLSVLGVTQECILSWALRHSYRSNLMLFQHSPWCVVSFIGIRPLDVSCCFQNVLQVFFVRRRGAAGEAQAGVRLT